MNEYNITVSQDDLDKAWKDAVNSYGGDEKAFVDMITQVGFTKETYLENIKSSLAQQKLRKEVASVDEPSDEEIVSYLNENLGTYNDARRSSHILFKVAEDASEKERAKVEAEAQKVLDKLNAGELEFGKAAKKYSEDSSADDGGDVGWDKLTTFVTEYQDALNGLSAGQMSGLVKTNYGYHIILCTEQFNVKLTTFVTEYQDALNGLSAGQMSGLVKTNYGYHIILCTEQFNVTEVASVDEIPAGIRDAIAERITSAKESEKYGAWLKDYTEKADIEIKKMPAEVPYNIDVDVVLSGDKSEDKAE